MAFCRVMVTKTSRHELLVPDYEWDGVVAAAETEVVEQPQAHLVSVEMDTQLLDYQHLQCNECTVHLVSEADVLRHVVAAHPDLFHIEGSGQ